MTASARLPLRDTLVEASQLFLRIVRDAIGVLALAAALSALATLWPIATLPAVVAALMAYGAALRIALTPDRDAARAWGLGPQGFQFGRGELRLLGSMLLCLLCWSIVAVTLALVILALFGAAQLDAQAIQDRNWLAVGPGWRIAILAVATLGALAILLGLAARLSLAGPQTVARARMISVQALALSRGTTATLTLAFVAAWLSVTAAASLLAAVAGSLSGITLAVLGLIPATVGVAAAAHRRLDISGRLP